MRIVKKILVLLLTVFGISVLLSGVVMAKNIEEDISFTNCSEDEVVEEIGNDEIGDDCSKKELPANINQAIKIEDEENLNTGNKNSDIDQSVHEKLQLSVLKQEYKFNIGYNNNFGGDDLQWETDNPEVVTVKPMGNGHAIFVAHKTGTAVITVMSENDECIVASIEVSVSNLICGVTYDPTGMTQDTYYYKEGVIQDVTDVINIDGAWYNVVKGKIVGNTVAKNHKGWWYIDSKGQVDFSYSGMAKNNNGWWIVKNGKVDFSVFDIINGKVNGKAGWWYIRNGKVQLEHTGIEKNRNGWWRIENGKVNFDCNSIEKNQNGWWYIRNGKVQFGYTGVEKNQNGWWRIENGKVNFKYNGLANNSNGWWYICNGKVNFNYTGMIMWNGQKHSVIHGKVPYYLNFVKKYEGVPYISGGASPKGWDCSGFSQWVIKCLGISIPKSAMLQAAGGRKVNMNNPSEWRPGDILVYSSGGRVNHVAVYLGNNQLMHAINSKYDTIVQDVDEYEKWDSKNSLTGVRRYL